MKLKALLLGLAIATSHTGYSMDGIQEPENAACRVVRNFVTIETEIYDGIQSITNVLAEILGQEDKCPSKVTWIASEEPSDGMRTLIESTNTQFSDGFIEFFKAIKAMDVSTITTAPEESQDELIESFVQEILSCHRNYCLLITKTSKDFFKAAEALEE